MTLLKKFLRNSLVTLVFLGFLLGSAGSLDYWQAWLYAGVSVAMNLATQLALRGNPDLSKERSKPGAGMQKWDKAVLGIGLLLTVITLVVAGLDTGRFHWSSGFPWEWSLLGVGLNVLGMAIFLRAMTENHFFSAVVRIQTDREQSVCTTGPYRLVRHPGYVGLIIGTLGFPFLFVSVWSVIPTLLSVATLIARTAMEDRFLEAQLKGYRDYQRITRYRLVPGIW
ncbi:MAG: methyltransferase family protein [Bdellovibrionota bacterium]